MSDLLKNIWRTSYLLVCFFKTSDLLIPSFLMSNASESLRSLTKNEQCEQIAQVAHQKGVTMRYLHRSLTQKWATMSESLRSLSKNERMSESVVFWGNSSFYNFFAKNEWFNQKTDERIPNPGKNGPLQVVTWQASLCKLFCSSLRRPKIYFVALHFSYRADKQINQRVNIAGPKLTLQPI